MNTIQNIASVGGFLAVVIFATIIASIEAREATAIGRSNNHYGDQVEFYSIQTNNIGDVRLTYPTIAPNMYGADVLKHKTIPCVNIHKAKELKAKMIANAKHKKAKEANKEWKEYNEQ